MERESSGRRAPKTMETRWHYLPRQWRFWLFFKSLGLLFHLKVDKYKHDNLKISKEKLETLSLSGNDFVGHGKRHQKTEKPGSKDNLKLATGKIEDETTSNTDFKVVKLLRAHFCVQLMFWGHIGKSSKSRLPFGTGQATKTDEFLENFQREFSRKFIRFGSLTRPNFNFPISESPK